MVSIIDAPIAEDVWSYKTADGVEHVSRIFVGRPRVDQNDVWHTPVFVAGVRDEVTRVSGVDAVDSLANAGAWIREVFAAFEEVSPRADDPDLAEREPAADWRPKVTRIDEPIAEAAWPYTTVDGLERVSRIVVGRPQANQNDSNRNWYTPIVVAGFDDKVRCIFGAGAVDSLANAGVFIRRLFAD